MRIKNSFTIFIVSSLTVICFYYILFSLYFYKLERNADVYSKGNLEIKKKYLESKKRIGFLKYNHSNARNKVLNLGLDLKGGISLILEISEKDLLKKFSNNSKNPIFLKALNHADQEKEKNPNVDYFSSFLNFFYKNKKKFQTDFSISDFFVNRSYVDEINYTDRELEQVIRKKLESSISDTYDILISRMDKFGVVQPNVQRIKKSNRILIELPGIENIDRVKNILRKRAELHFLEIYNFQEIFPFFERINKIYSKNEKLERVEPNNLSYERKTKSFIKMLNISKIKKMDNNLFLVGLVHKKEMNKITDFLNSMDVMEYLPYTLRNVKFLWGAKTYQENQEKYVPLFAVKEENNSLDGDMITSAYKSFGPLNEIFINIKMNQEGAKNWKIFTEKNIGRNIAIVLDDLVYTVPFIKSVIPNGISQISGKLSLQESEDLVNILSTGRLPTSVKIIQSEIVGPSLGKETIQKGIFSFFIAIIFVFIWMFYYYKIPGLYANIALIFNLLFIFGFLISINSVLTFPGIAGIILTLAMSMDSYVLIYEKIKEDMRNGISIHSAVYNSYTLQGALSSIIDGQVTTLLCGIILFFFGIGPIKGFSTTLIIGIFTSFFSSICLGKLFLEWHLNKYQKIFFRIWNSNKVSWDFLSKRKFSYAISFLCILGSLISFYYKGLNLGIDFVGGRTYIIRFDRKVLPDHISFLLSKYFIENGKPSFPKVLPFGEENKMKIVTKYKIWNEKNQIDQEIFEKMFLALKPYFHTIDFQDFKTIDKDKTLGILSSEKVEPVIAKYITKNAFISILLSLFGIFFYIFIRFKKWQFGLGALVSLLHDIIIVIGLFSIFHEWFFVLEIDQSFLAALLTIIGYSINDTVIVYDKIRKFSSKKFFSIKEIINKGIHSSLTRTMNTSFMTILTICIIFFFGGTTIRSFMLALFFGVSIGTYSSIFIASSIVYDLSKKKEKNDKSFIY
ncbi:protein translocase subunit SecDF [Blattabacterium cuenoti]|uniref:protein translocase subunit SecDF n=1 Tax=Blattabacterium cuenoti TaxID=1653831 RepID=UPI00163C5F57|nr:protein translocase subunit SecDF [Blattabacterium cuenoti]